MAGEGMKIEAVGQTELVEVKEPGAPAVADEAIPDDEYKLITLALKYGASVDQLERLIALKNSEEERKAKRLFADRFAELRAKLPPVPRSKKGDKSKYSPIEEIQKLYDPIISAHGFSYWWDREALPDGGLRTFLYISGHGHERSNHIDLPHYTPDTGSSSGKAIMNAMQAEGARYTYGRRYSFIDGFGAVMEDEDTDGSVKLTLDDGVEYGDHIRALEAETDVKALDELAKVYRNELRKANDQRGFFVVTEVYKRRKKELENAAAK